MRERPVRSRASTVDSIDMGRKASLLLLGLFLSAVLAGCARHTALVAHDLALPSGEHVTILDAHGDSFTDVSGVKRHVFYIAYHTAHDIDDIPSLRREALRVWAAYKPQIIGIDYNACVVTPMKQTARGDEAGRPFYVTRYADGTWALP